MELRSHRKLFIGNTVFLVMTNGVAQLVSLLVVPLFVGNLGAELYGLYVLTGTIVGQAAILDLGFTQGLQRFIARGNAARDNEQLSRVVVTGSVLLALFGVIVGSLLLLTRHEVARFFGLVGREYTIALELLLVSAIFSFIEWPMRMPSTVLQATLRIREDSIIRGLSGVLMTLVMLAMVVFVHDLVLIRIAAYGVVVISWIPSVLLMRRFQPGLRFDLRQFTPRTLLKMVPFSLGMFYVNLMILLAIRIDPLIIGRMITVKAITSYVVASKLFEAVRSQSGQLMGAFLPTVFNLDSDDDRRRLQTLLDDGVRYRALIVSPIAWLGIVISPAFICTWMGAEYHSVALWSQLLMVVHLANVFGIALNLARGMGRLRLANTAQTAAVVGNLTLSVLLVEGFGVGGPILGTVISSSVFVLVSFPVFCGSCGVEWRRAFRQGVSIVVINAPLALLALYVLSRVLITTWIPLLLVSTLLAAVFYGTVFLAFVGDRERNDLFTALQAIGLRFTRDRHHR